MEPIDRLSPSVKLYLLGAPRLEQNGAPIVIDRRKAVALLAYLALTGQTHLRDALATLLWPDSGQSHARANLRHTLVVLKQALGDDSLDIAWESVARQPEAALWIDVLHFQALLMACRSHSHPPGDVCAVCLPLLMEAVALPAEQFMAGFSLTDSPAFDDWQRAQQQQLTQALSDALDCLVRYFTQTGDYKRAIAYAQRRLGIDTLDEAAHRQLIQLYAWSGQQGLALRQFEQCTGILTQELGVAPSAETARLVQEIRAGRAAAPVTGLSEAASNQQPPAAEAAWRPATPRHNLPLRRQPLIGRDQDLRAIQALLQRATVNLVTLIGPGGVGKTQLSIQLASTLLEHFTDGVFFVSLAPLHEAAQVISALAQTWHLPEQADRPLLERVQTYLRHKQMLLILDNFEHLIAAAPAVSELLAHCAHLRILVTSREGLNLQGEQLYPIAPLSLPVPSQRSVVTAVAEAAAVQLFVQRAQAVSPGFMLEATNAADIADICTHLDGLPLAIELVAARIRLLPLRTLRQRLLGTTTASFELLQGGARDAPLRHRTLKDAITWSYDLLTAAEKRLFRLLAVFVGGCTLDAVEQVSAFVGEEGSDSVLANLASLVNKSMVQQTVQPDGEARFSLLEMIREFGLEQAQANGGFLAATARAHAETYATFVETAEPALAGPDHLTWITRLNAEHDNCRVALHWAISHQQAELAMRLGGALWSYWLDRGFYGEGRRFLATILQLEGTASRTPLRARALLGLGALIGAQGDLTKARTYQEEAVAIYREWADERGLAIALEFLAQTATRDPDMGPVYVTEAAALYEKLKDPIGVARMRQELGYVKYDEGDYRTAQTIFEQIIAIYKTQHYEAGLGFTLFHLGRALFQQQNFTRASQHFAEALQRAQARGDQELVAEVLYFMGRVAYTQTEYAKARNLFEESLRIGRELGIDAAKIAFRLAFLGDIALAQRDAASARTLLRESLTLGHQADNPYVVSLTLARFASRANALGEGKRAVHLVAAARSLYQTLPFHLLPNDQILFDAPLATARRSLSAEQFEQAWAVGAQMTMDEAVALAMAEINDALSPSVDNQQHR